MEKKIRIFFQETLEENTLITLDKAQSHYLSTVMRTKIGKTLKLFNSFNGEFEGKILSMSKKEVAVKISKKTRGILQKSKISLAFCPPKNTKLDFLIQKCTELGVKKFIPVVSDHTVNRKINLTRLKKIIIETCEQSNQIQIPTIDEPLKFKDFKNILSNELVLFADIKSKELSIEKIAYNEKKNYILFIGPEGDFSQKERKQINDSKNFKSFSLGDNILRTETAAIASLTLLNYFIN